VETLRATHCSLGEDDRVQGQRADFRAADPDRFAGFPTLLERANALDLSEQIELAEVRGNSSRELSADIVMVLAEERKGFAGEEEGAGDEDGGGRFCGGF